MFTQITSICVNTSKCSDESVKICVYYNYIDYKFIYFTIVYYAKHNKLAKIIVISLGIAVVVQCVSFNHKVLSNTHTRTANLALKMSKLYKLIY